MELTLEQAATRLGKSVRQIRYMIQQDRLPARKFAGRWVVDSKNLPLSEGQRRAVQRKEGQLRGAVEQALGLTDEDRPARYSVRDLKAFQVALPIYRQSAEEIGAEHSITLMLRSVLEQLSCGCHRYDRADKAEAYRQARDAASQAVCELVLLGTKTGDELVSAIEQELMAALAGLLRRVDRRRKL